MLTPRNVARLPVGSIDFHSPELRPCCGPARHDEVVLAQQEIYVKSEIGKGPPEILGDLGLARRDLAAPGWAVTNFSHFRLTVVIYYERNRPRARL